ncbi:hypothetical protein Pint_34644 [Pistacia integerrima]|uniref:Uncharacterized protein n=1 Tax=Pistacia integerrima TaxID=434235 RepID=A0ACC0X6D6_9ROSI|nr:hypothetical protein Pint_34644 [Pistacia integerrima]
MLTCFYVKLVASGTLMHCSSHNNTLPVIHMIHSFYKNLQLRGNCPEDYVERVKRVHEVGGYGSRGYGYDWKREEANKNLLRTHTTAVSSRMLKALAEKPFAPKRYFSIDRVFRNEAVDRTHLAEFHQIEGVDKLFYAMLDLGLAV